MNAGGGGGEVAVDTNLIQLDCGDDDTPATGATYADNDDDLIFEVELISALILEAMVLKKCASSSEVMYCVII